MRYLVLAELIRSGDAMAVRDLVDRLGRQGILLPPKPSKVVSDAIRWEVRKGRVVKRGRGVYQLGHIPRSTRYWVLSKADACREWHTVNR